MVGQECNCWNFFWHLQLKFGSFYSYQCFSFANTPDINFLYSLSHRNSFYHILCDESYANPSHDSQQYEKKKNLCTGHKFEDINYEAKERPFQITMWTEKKRGNGKEKKDK